MVENISTSRNGGIPKNRGVRLRRTPLFLGFFKFFRDLLNIHLLICRAVDYELVKKGKIAKIQFIIRLIHEHQISAGANCRY
jgi:hypothetical protein